MYEPVTIFLNQVNLMEHLHGPVGHVNTVRKVRNNEITTALIDPQVTWGVWTSCFCCS